MREGGLLGDSNLSLGDIHSMEERERTPSPVHEEVVEGKSSAAAADPEDSWKAVGVQGGTQGWLTKICKEKKYVITKAQLKWLESQASLPNHVFDFFRFENGEKQAMEQGFSISLINRIRQEIKILSGIKEMWKISSTEKVAVDVEKLETGGEAQYAFSSAWYTEDHWGVFASLAVAKIRPVWV
eukprot:gb/GEZN01001597.1/.p2 GENE.gb/GEZN01001597.1/~~gb/GEZN01001597.1/.p2  ORF type:complete len:184 (+),score=33.66 gb/GEZN01001597.1/:127-678(+)